MFEKTPLEGLFIYRPRVHHDERGYFYESYNVSHFKDIAGFRPFVQDNRSLSAKGTLRGFHFQKPPHEQAKLVGLLKGRAFDVAIDIRPQSSTFGQWFGTELNMEDPKFIYIPRGFAHGFMALEEDTEIFYKVDEFYNKAAEGGITFNDPEISVQWPSISSEIILSPKDRSLPPFQLFRSSKNS